MTEPTAAHREQASRLWAQCRDGDAIHLIDALAAAIAAAEKRGEDRIRAKVEALADRWASVPADWLRSTVAPEEPPCMCGKPESDLIHQGPQTSAEQHAYERAPTESEWYADHPQAGRLTASSVCRECGRAEHALGRCPYVDPPAQPEEPHP